MEEIQWNPVNSKKIFLSNATSQSLNRYVILFLSPSNCNFPGDEYQAQLVSAGVSPQAIEGILKVCADGKDAYSKYGDSPSFHDAIECVTKLYVDLERFIKTQSEKDQASYAKFQVKRGAEYKN